MASAGRSRKIAPRESNGRVQRPNVAKLKTIEQEKHAENTAVALAQPHRRGDADPRRVSAIGRFCQRMKLRHEIYEAAVDHLKVRKWWGAAVGRPQGFENSESRGGAGPSDETVRGWLNEMIAVDRLLVRIAPYRKNLFFRVAIDDVDQAPGPDDDLLVSALLDLAVFKGRMSARSSAFG